MLREACRSKEVFHASELVVSERMGDRSFILPSELGKRVVSDIRRLVSQGVLSKASVGVSYSPLDGEMLDLTKGNVKVRGGVDSIFITVDPKIRKTLKELLKG